MRLTHDRLKTLLSYNPESGHFIWLVSTSNRALVGTVAGCLCRKSGYVLIGIDGVVYKANRLAWFYMTGEWPAGIVDHRNTIRNDDRWDNLRLATQAQNLSNRGAQKNNTSGFKGVSEYAPGRWCARVTASGKTRRMNGFSDPADAAMAYARMANEVHGDFARTE